MLAWCASAAIRAFSTTPGGNRTPEAAAWITCRGACRVGTRNARLSRKSCAVGSSRKIPCSIERTPARSARAIPVVPCACARTYLPCSSASSTITRSSSSVYWAWRGSSLGVSTPPVAQTLRWRGTDRRRARLGRHRNLLTPRVVRRGLRDGQHARVHAGRIPPSPGARRRIRPGSSMTWRASTRMAATGTTANLIGGRSVERSREVPAGARSRRRCAPLALGRSGQVPADRLIHSESDRTSVLV